jgi:Flp pilus assembly pilin Flp
MNVRIVRDIARGVQRDERGLTTVEYVIVLCLIAVVAVGTWKTFGANIQTYLSGADAAITGQMPAEVRTGAPPSE